MAEQGDGAGEIDRRLVEVAADPLQRRALSFVNDRPGDGAAQLAGELGVDLEAARAVLEELREHGFVERISGAGDGEPGYRALTRALWTDQELAELSIEERHRLDAWIVKMVEADVHKAMAAGTLARNVDTHITRTVSSVDVQGWRELTRIQDEALAAIFAVQEAAAERLAERGEEGVPVLTAMLCCQLPDERGQSPG